MFNEQKIVACLGNLVQFENVADPSYGTIDSTLTQSATGRLVSSAHSYATIENLFNVAPEFSKYNYPAWVTGTYLKAGQHVKDAGVLYNVKVDILAADNTVAPVAGPNFEVSNPFSAWLQDLKNQAAIELISKLIEMKKLNEAGKTILESLRLYEGGGLFSDRVINKNNFACLEIQLMPNENIQTVITEIGLQMDGAVTVPMYLYHTSISTPLSITNVDARGSLSFNWKQVKLLMQSVDYDPDLGHDAGGLFYIGYYQDDLEAVQAINKNFSFGYAGCSSCNAYNSSAFVKWSKRVRIRSGIIDPYDIKPGRAMFDPMLIAYTPNSNWGINLAISVNCDISNFICKNSLVFADAMAKMLALKCLQKIAYTTRITAIASNVKDLAMAELNTDPKSSSFYSEYIAALKALDIEFGGFDADCLPCANRRFQMKYGAV